MKRSIDKALEQAAHLYVDAADSCLPDKPYQNRVKNIARFRLQKEALEFAADFMEQWTQNLLDGGDRKRACAAGVAQLRESVLDIERVIKEIEARNV